MADDFHLTDEEHENGLELFWTWAYATEALAATGFNLDELYAIAKAKAARPTWTDQRRRDVDEFAHNGALVKWIFNEAFIRDHRQRRINEQLERSGLAHLNTPDDAE